MANVGDFISNILLTFIPIFVAIDAIGNLPFLLSLTESMSDKERTRAIRVALITATGVGLFFLVVGKIVLLLLSIEVADFLIAGGIILLALSIKDLTTGRMIDLSTKEEMVAVVPIGTPLLAGPAMLTTLLLLFDQLSNDHSTIYSAIILMIAFLINLIVAWGIFSQSNRIASWLGEGGLKAVTKIASLLLAAIAVKMIRVGIMDTWSI